MSHTRRWNAPSPAPSSPDPEPGEGPLFDFVSGVHRPLRHNLILLHAPVLELLLLALHLWLTSCILRHGFIRSNVRPCPALPRDGPPGIAVRACKGEVGKWHPRRTQKCTIQTPRKTQKAPMWIRSATSYSARRCAIMRSASSAWKRPSSKPSRPCART